MNVKRKWVVLCALRSIENSEKRLSGVCHLCYLYRCYLYDFADYYCTADFLLLWIFRPCFVWSFLSPPPLLYNAQFAVDCADCAVAQCAVFSFSFFSFCFPLAHLLLFFFFLSVSGCCCCCFCPDNYLDITLTRLVRYFACLACPLVCIITISSSSGHCPVVFYLCPLFNASGVLLLLIVIMWQRWQLEQLEQQHQQRRQ